MNDTDLDGGRPLPKNWIKESDENTQDINKGKKDEGTTARVLRFPRKGTR